MIAPDWPASGAIRAYTTTRLDGCSLGNYASFNLAEHVNDVLGHIAHNRQQLHARLDLPEAPLWLTQVHGTRIIHSREWQAGTVADGCVTDEPNKICAILTADCLPVLLCNQQGSKVAAVHVGWRGLLDGILLSTLEQLKGQEDHWLAWLGPAIQQPAFEVGEELYTAFCERYGEAEQAFIASHRAGYWQMDIMHIVRMQLQSFGITKIYGGHWCTFRDKTRFFSHRRDGRNGDDTGRMASLIWISK